jgi:hypothetical protein
MVFSALQTTIADTTADTTADTLPQVYRFHCWRLIVICSVVEPGEFKAMVGHSPAEVRLNGSFEGRRNDMTERRQ